MAILINNVAYNWSMVQITAPDLGFNGTNPVELIGVSALSWNIKREVKKNYGLGGHLASRGFGNRECEAKITMDYRTQDAIRNGAASLIDIGQFDLVVSFADPVIDNGVSEAGGVPGDNSSAWTTQTVTIKGCVFSEDGMESKSGDENIDKEFDLNPLDIILQ